MKIEWVVLISIACTILGATIGYLNWRRTCNTDLKAETEDSSTLRSDVGYIKKAVDEIRIDQKVQEKRINDMNERLVRNEESTKQAHKRIDEIQR